MGELDAQDHDGRTDELDPDAPTEEGGFGFELDAGADEGLFPDERTEPGPRGRAAPKIGATPSALRAAEALGAHFQPQPSAPVWQVVLLGVLLIGGAFGVGAALKTPNAVSHNDDLALEAAPVVPELTAPVAEADQPAATEPSSVE